MRQSPLTRPLAALASTLSHKGRGKASKPLAFAFTDLFFKQPRLRCVSACKANAPPPVFFVEAPGAPVVAVVIGKVRGGGAPKSANHLSSPLRLEGFGGPRPTLMGAPHSGTPPAAFLSPAPCFRAGLAERSSRPLAGWLPPPLASRLVQPFKAAGLSAGGRLAGASRAPGYKPCPRAPPPPRVGQCPAGRPSLWDGCVDYKPRNMIVSRAEMGPIWISLATGDRHKIFRLVRSKTFRIEQTPMGVLPRILVLACPATPPLCPPIPNIGAGHRWEREIMSLYQTPTAHSDSISRPACPTCGMQMMLARIHSDQPDQEQRTFECGRCRNVESVTVKMTQG